MMEEKETVHLHQRNIANTVMVSEEAISERAVSKSATSENVRVKSSMPVLFIGHGSPMNLIEDNPWTKEWEKIAANIPKPKAILMISAHWYTAGSFVQGDAEPAMIYDMYGFPEPIYELQYPAHTSKPLIEWI